MKQPSQRWPRIVSGLLAVAIAYAAIASRDDDAAIPTAQAGHAEETGIGANSALHAHASLHGVADLFPAR